MTRTISPQIRQRRNRHAPLATISRPPTDNRIALYGRVSSDEQTDNKGNTTRGT